MHGDPPQIRLLRREDCPLCDEAEAILENLQGELTFSLDLIDVDEDTQLRLTYGDRVPVALHDDEELFDLQAGAAQMQAAIRSAVAD